MSMFRVPSAADHDRCLRALNLHRDALTDGQRDLLNRVASAWACSDRIDPRTLRRARALCEACELGIPFPANSGVPGQ